MSAAPVAEPPNSLKGTDSSLKTTIEEATRHIEQVKGLDAFNNETTMNAMKYIHEAYQTFKTLQFRRELADELAKIGFAELAVKMKTWINDEGPFKSEETGALTRVLFSHLWNYSDKSLLLCQRLIEADFVRLVLIDLKHPPYLQNLDDKNVRYLLFANVNILHNVSKVHELREKFYELDTISVLQPLLQCSDDDIRAVTTMAIAHIIKEEDNDKIMAAEDILSRFAKMLASALATGNHRFRWFSAEELADALGLLAVNDANKKKIMDAGAGVSFRKMLTSKREAEQLVALKAISNLAFNAEVRAAFQLDVELMTQLQTLSQSANEHIKRLTASALWVINDKSGEKAKQEGNKEEKTQSKKGHVMISYNWSHQPVLLRVRDALQAAGCVVWMDVDDISGSTLQAMAEAIEGASLVLMCMSENYKNSPNCRIEAEYAFQRQKPILPLLMQRGYKADGWLGIILGSKLFVEFSDKYPFEKSANNLIQQVKHMRAEVSGVTLGGQVSSKAAPAPVQSSQQFVKWSRDDVARWLTASGFERYTDKFSEVDGNCLDQLLEMRKSAPEFFFKSMKDDMCLRFTDILRFCSEMDKLS